MVRDHIDFHAQFFFNSHTGSQTWITWKDILALTDIICCCAILFPIIWSIKKLRDEFKQHVISFADENGEPFYVSEETKQELVNDGLGDVGGALTAKEQAEKLEKLAPDGDVSDLPAGFAVLQNDLMKQEKYIKINQK